MLILALTISDAIDVGVTAEDLSNLKLYAQYAGAAYCDPVAGKPVYCKGDICPAGSKSNATIYSVFHGIETDILGFIAVDASMKQIIVSVRGSSSICRCHEALLRNSSFCSREHRLETLILRPETC